MTTFRQIHTQIWKDDYFMELDPAEKMLFIYLFSNESTSLTGLYKISMRVICFETGLDKGFVIDALKKFEQAGKVCYENGLMWVVNMRKYHETRSPKIKIAIENDLAKIPNCPLKKRYLTGNIPYAYPMHTDPHQIIPDTDKIIPEADKNEEPHAEIPYSTPVVEVTTAATASKSSIVPERQAERLLLKVARIAALPPNQYNRLEQVLSMIQAYGETKVETAMMGAFKTWINTPRKNGTGNYSPLNFGWIDKAQEHLVDYQFDKPKYHDNMTQAELLAYLGVNPDDDNA